MGWPSPRVCKASRNQGISISNNWLKFALDGVRSTIRRDRRSRQDSSGRCACATYQEIARKDPDNVDTQTGLAITSNNLGVIYLALDQSAPAFSAALDAVRANEQLVRIHRSVPGFRAGLAGSHNNLASVYERYGPVRLAEEQLRTACSLSRDLVKDHPTVRDYTHFLGKHLTNLAIFLTSHSKKPEAIALCREAIELIEPMARENASDLCSP